MEKIQEINKHNTNTDEESDSNASQSTIISNNPTIDGSGINPLPEMEKVNLNKRKFSGSQRKHLKRLLKSGTPYEEALQTFLHRSNEVGTSSTQGTKCKLKDAGKNKIQKKG